MQNTDGLQLLQDLKQGVFEASRDAIFLANEAGILEQVNDSACRLMERSRDDLLGSHQSSLHPQEERARYRRIFEHHLQNPGGVLTGLDIVRPSGERVPVEISSSGFQVGGKPYLMGVFRDVTERNRLQEQLERSQRLEAIGLLAAGIAHDFNNLLTVIQGCAIYLRGRPTIKTDEASLGALEDVLDSSGRAANLTRQLLTFSSQSVTRPRLIDLNVIIDTAHSMLRRMIPESIDLQVAFAPEPLILLADPGHIEQIIVNLIVNARDAMPSGGTLRVSTSADNGEAIINVTDNGVGMTKAVQRRIFDPFYTTKGLRGTGLGLATVYGIVQHAQGRVRVESTVGAGSTFTVYLPRTEGSAQATPMLAPISEKARVLTILVVDDEPNIRRVVKRTLATVGHKAVLASTASEAIAAAESTQIGLLLTDVVMPDTNGRELATKLQGLGLIQRVLYMSGYTDDVVLRHGVFTSKLPFIQKPFTPSELLDSIHRVMES